MMETQQLAFELRLNELRERAEAGIDLTGCMLAASSAHDADERLQTSTIRYLAEAGVSVHEVDKNGVTPLHRAVRFRNLAAVRVLIELGADVNVKDRRSQSTPLHRAVTDSGAPATAGKGAVAVEIAKILLARGADPRAKNKIGRAPADYAKNKAMSELFGA